MPKWILLAVVIAVLIVIFYMIMKKKDPRQVFSDTFEHIHNAAKLTYDKTFTSPEKLYSDIVGHEGGSASKTVLAKLRSREKLIQTNERRHRISKNKRNQAATNAFMLADIYQYNETDNAHTEIERDRAREMAGDYYTRAMLRIREHPVETVEGNEVETNGPAVDLMIDRADEFFRENADMPANVEINFANMRDTVRNARVKVYKGATTKQATQKSFFTAKVARSDPQNVHEPQVSNELERIYKHIKMENAKEEMITGGLDNRNEPTIADIRAFINAHKFTDEGARTRALSILDTMSKGNEISKLHDNERNVLLNVWKRVNSSDNTANRENLKAAFMDAIASGMEKNHYGEYAQVCANGRCGRVINSLTLLDADDTISKPIKTREMIKNDVLSNAYAIVQDELKKAPTDVAKAYNGVTPENTLDDDLRVRLEGFIANVKDKIAIKATQEYKNEMDPTTLNNIILDAQSGV